MGTYGFGAVPSPKDVRDYRLSASAMKVEVFPESFCLPHTKIKNQGSRFTCVAHTLSSLVEFYNLRDTNQPYIFSTDFIYGCREDDDYLGDGMYLRDGLKVLQKYGDVLYSQLPGNTDVPTAREKVRSNFEELVAAAEPNRISTYYKIQSISELKHALMNDGPVPAAMKWFKGAVVRSNGVYKYTSTEIRDYHAILILGWNKDYIIAQNSWGITWGKDGLLYIPIDKWSEVFCEFYGVTDEINNVAQPKLVIKKFGPFINLIIYLIDKLIHKKRG